MPPKRGCHHEWASWELGVERDCLFCDFYGVPEENGPIGLLKEEHANGRKLVYQLQNVLDRVHRGDASANADWIETARSYSALLAGHILKEDQILFPIGELVIPTAAQTQIWEVFESDDYAVSGQECCEDFLKQALMLVDQGKINP